MQLTCSRLSYLAKQQVSRSIVYIERKDVNWTFANGVSCQRGRQSLLLTLPWGWHSGEPTRGPKQRDVCLITNSDLCTPQCRVCSVTTHYCTVCSQCTSAGLWQLSCSISIFQLPQRSLSEAVCHQYMRLKLGLLGLRSTGTLAAHATCACHCAIDVAVSSGPDVRWEQRQMTLQ